MLWSLWAGCLTWTVYCAWRTKRYRGHDRGRAKRCRKKTKSKIAWEAGDGVDGWEQNTLRRRWKHHQNENNSKTLSKVEEVQNSVRRQTASHYQKKSKRPSQKEQNCQTVEIRKKKSKPLSVRRRRANHCQKKKSKPLSVRRRSANHCQKKKGKPLSEDE